MNEVQKTIADLRALLATPERWCQGCPARDKNGLESSVASPDTCAWDIAGGLIKVQSDFGLQRQALRFVREAVIELAGIENYTVWQDQSTRTHAEVLAAFDAAISLALQEQPQ